MDRELIEYINSLLYLNKYRGDCLKCGNKNTFSVTREGTDILFYCFHVNCGIKGRIKDDLSLDYIRTINFNSVDNFRQVGSNRCKTISEIGPFSGINIYCRLFLSRYNITGLDLDLKYDPKQNRLVFPLINHEKELRGYVGRALDSGTYPKWMVYFREMECPYILEYVRSNSCIIVEDCISALRICNVSNAIAILGTSISSGVIPYLTPYSKLFVALDPDALHKSVKIAKYLNYFVPTDILPITRDLKYYSDEELEEIRKKISE